MPKPGMEMPVRRRLEKENNTRWPAAGGGQRERWLGSLPGEVVPHTGRISIEHVARGAAIAVTVSTDEGPAAQFHNIQPFAYLGISGFVFCFLFL